jgi:hypothetical protein
MIVGHKILGGLMLCRRGAILDARKGRLSPVIWVTVEERFLVAKYHRKMVSGI